jgi:hypothetical protein
VHYLNKKAILQIENALYDKKMHVGLLGLATWKNKSGPN